MSDSGSFDPNPRPVPEPGADVAKADGAGAPPPYEELLSRPGEATSRFLSERAETPAALGRRMGLGEAAVGFLEAMAFDMRERDRRIAVLASRHWPGLAAKAVGALLSGGEVEAASEGVGVPDVERLLAAPADATLPAPRRSGPRVLVCEQSFRDARAGGGVAGLLLKPDAVREALEARLRAEDVHLIVALRFDEDSRRLVEDLPEAYLLPWLDLWLASFETRCDDALRGDVEDRVGERLRAICGGTAPAARVRERELFLRLEDLVLGGARPGQAFEEALEEAVEASARGEAGRKASALARLREVMGDGDRIARTLFTVRVHVPDEPWAAVRRIVEALLPANEPVSSLDDLPPRLVARWQESLAAAEARGGGRPPLPSWREVFLHDADRHVERGGLQNVDGRIGPHASFRLSDPARLVADNYPAFLEALHADFARARPYARADMSLESLAAFHLALAETLDLKSRVSGWDWTRTDAADAFARVLSGAPDEAGEELPVGRIAAALGALAREEERRGRDPKPFVNALLMAFARLMPRERLTMLLSAFALGLRAGWDEGVAEADLWSATLAVRDAAARRAPAAVAEAENARRRSLDVLVHVADLASVAGGEAVPSARPWLDGLRAAARENRYAALGLPVGAIATYAEDFATQASIDLPYDWKERPEPALARDLFDAPAEGGAGAPARGLIVRMLARDPRAWLADLDAYERFAAPAAPTGSFLDRLFRLEDAVYWRLRDVLAVLLGGLDEAALRYYARGGEDEDGAPAGRESALRRARRTAALVSLGETVWPALARELGLAPVGSLEAARDRVLDAHRRPHRAGAPDDLSLLSLYPAALLSEWRLRRFTEAPIDPGDPGYARHRDLLHAIRDDLGQAGRREAVSRSFRALAAAQKRLADRVEAARLAGTAARFRRKATVMERLAACMAPPAPRPPPPAVPSSTFDLGTQR